MKKIFMMTTLFCGLVNLCSASNPLHRLLEVNSKVFNTTHATQSFYPVASTAGYTNFSGKWQGRCSDEDKDYVIQISNNEVLITYDDGGFLPAISLPVSSFDASRKKMVPTGDEVLHVRIQAFWSENKTELHIEALIAGTSPPEKTKSGLNVGSSIDYYATTIDEVIKIENDKLMTEGKITPLVGATEEDKEHLTCVYERVY